MAKDYKGRGGRRRDGAAGRSKKAARPAPRRRGGTAGRGRNTAPRGAPGWQWLLAGFACGLLVAAGVFVYDRLPHQAASVGGAPVADPPAARAAAPAPARKRAPPPPPEPQYEFYELLPSYEVVIAEEEAGATAQAPPAVEQPGNYILQAGSFRNHADADRRKATLALQGIESRIQVVTIDSDRAWHRVRIGPVDDLGELNDLRDRLRDTGIEFLVIRVDAQ